MSPCGWSGSRRLYDRTGCMTVCPPAVCWSRQLDGLVPGLPPDVVAAVTRATAFAPADRQPDVVALGVALGGCLGLSPLSAAATMGQP